MAKLPMNLREIIREGVNEKIKSFLNEHNHAIFFNNEILLRDGSELISLTSNTTNAVLTTKRKGQIHRSTLQFVDMGIIEDVLNALYGQGNTRSCFGWIIESNDDDSWFETSDIPYNEEETCYLDMATNAADYARECMIDCKLNEDFKPITLLVDKDRIKVSWLTYKLVKFDGLE